MKKTIILFTIFIFFWSCIFKLENENHKAGNSYITITSNFTDAPGTQMINLHYSSNTTSDNGSIETINDAIVSIYDDQNNKINFTPSGNGKYLSTASGKPGRIYTLHFTLANGKSYHSLPEKIPVTPEIDNLYYKFESDNSQTDYKKKYGYNVYIDFKDSPEQGEFYQWKWIHYELINACATCSAGYVFDNNKQGCVKAVISPNNDNANNDGVNYFKCTGNCWGITGSDGFNVLSDNYYNGQNVPGVKVHRVDFKSLPSEYYLQIQQSKINKSTYLYLKSLETQIKSNGTLFDVPAQTQFNFNVFSDDDPNEKILGLFNVYSYKMKVISIPINRVVNGLFPARGDLDKTFYTEGDRPPVYVYADCVNGLNKTPFQPEGWK